MARTLSAKFQNRSFDPFGSTVATGHTKKREDDIVLLLYVVSLSTALAPFLLRALRCG